MLDGRDVEFILGGTPRQRRACVLYHRLRPDAQSPPRRWTNDPYMPRAESPFWPACLAGHEAALLRCRGRACLGAGGACSVALAANWHDAWQERTDDGLL